jgi:hypothetical protein
MLKYCNALLQMLVETMGIYRYNLANQICLVPNTYISYIKERYQEKDCHLQFLLAADYV